MKLRTKSVLVICAGFSIFCFILSLILNNVITVNYLDLESESVSENVGRVLNQFNQENINLEAVASDWSMWDDTYFFVEDKNEIFIQSNLNYESYEDLNINFMLFYNNSGTLVFSRAYDFQVENETILPASLFSCLSDNKDFLLMNHSIESSQSGILLYDTKETPLFISTSAILNSNRDAPPHGVLIVGRFLDKTKVESFENITQLTIILHPLSSQFPVDFERTSAYVQGIPIFIQPINSTYVAGYVKINDIIGNQVFILEVGSNRDFFNQGITMIQNLIITLIFTMVILIVIVIYFLDKFVTSRLTYLTKSVNDIKKYEDLSKHLKMEGNDEISMLEKNINNMLVSLQKSWAMKDSAEFSLQKKIDELERFKIITVDREIKMIELKKENKTLKGMIPKQEVRDEKAQT
jgi:sensor domain CHASE-containing protein